jgi:hypothetical protein
MKERILFVIFTFLVLYLTLNLHSRTGYLTYKSEIYADKAGYYSYLPAAFVFGFDGEKVPAGLKEATGEGISLNSEGKIFTKYPLGVALMQAPFFLVTHYIVAPLLDYPADGFTAPYHKMIDVAAWAYFVLGFWLMALVLREYFSPKIVMAALILFLCGTNLLYYATVETGMSHIYSFFLASALMRLTQLIHRRQRFNAWMGLALGAVAGLLIVTRFTNAFLLLIPLFWEVDSLDSLAKRLRLLCFSKGIFTVGIVPLAVISLQMGYYFYLSGSPFYYSYAKETFDFAHPSILQVWFSTYNGLFLFSPIMLFALIGLGRMAHQRIAGAWLGIGVFLATSFVFASWWQWFFGCAFGARSFVEYAPIYLVAFGYFLQWLGTKSVPWRFAIWPVMIVLAAINFKNAYLFKLCYLGVGDWDFAWYWELVLSA